MLSSKAWKCALSKTFNQKENIASYLTVCPAPWEVVCCYANVKKFILQKQNERKQKLNNKSNFSSEQSSEYSTAINFSLLEEQL